MIQPRHLACGLTATVLLTQFTACDKAPSPAPEAPIEAATNTVAPASQPTSQPDDEPQTRSSWQPIAREAMHPATVAQLEKGLQAQNELGGALLGALSHSIQSDGFASSIVFCQGAAPDLAENVGAKWGVEIGRTSHRLRNPKNTPPHWAEPLVEKRPEQQVFVLGPQGELGIFSPIPTAELCTNCHGASETLAPGVEAALTKLYPDDEATGFAAGELRGWFWVEVPPPS